MTEAIVRRHLQKALACGDAHVTFDRAVKGLPVRLRGAVPAGMPHSPWQLVEHLRLAQADLLEFCVSRHYREKRWPADYWPRSAAPRSAAAWARSVAAFRRDRRAMQRLVSMPSTDLSAPVPSGEAHQTYLREFLLILDHSAYHVGQLVLVRRALGAWPEAA